jgi:hypothetical protein
VLNETHSFPSETNNFLDLKAPPLVAGPFLLPEIANVTPRVVS